MSNSLLISRTRIKLLLCFALMILVPDRVRAETPSLDIPSEIIEDSPVLQKWLQEVPNILDQIHHDPSFRTRLGVGFAVFPDDDLTGVKIAIEDIFLGRTGLTISADYQTSFNNNRVNTGTDLHYFLFPLGGFVNVAPIVGYRYVESSDFNTDGVNLGLRVMLALSRTGAADISLSQSFVSPQGDREIGLFRIGVGYSFTSDIRISTDWKIENSKEDKDNSLSIGLQYLF